ncbi:MAG: hypothetical protein WCB27_18495 [Thermoguttaceae bacterium]
MTTSSCRFGFRIVGGCFETRRLVDAAAAFSAHAAADPRCEPDKECYLSAFRFDESFRRHLEDNQGSTASYSGPCWSPWLWFDLDNEELQYVHKDAAALAAFLVERYGVEPDELLMFFSGSKGFHVGLATALWSPEPSDVFHKVCRRFAEHVAELAAVTIDTGVYDRVRAFRAPNSRHPKTGLHKSHLSLDELTGLPLEKIIELSREPAAFPLPTPTRHNDNATADWQAAVEQVAREGEAKAQRHTAANGTPTLNRSTLYFIRGGASAGDRHRLLYSAAANLAEFACPSALAVALLEESGLDSGLPPKEIRRQIECGLAAVASPSPPIEDSTPTAVATVETPPAVDMQAALSALWSAGKTAMLENTDKMTVEDNDEMTVLPPLPEPLLPLPPGAVGSGTLDTPCKCGSREFVDVAISEGRSRRDCRKCGRFLGWGKWHDQGGPTP